MTKPRKKPTEVLTYLQNLRKYFETNDTAQMYFLISGNEEPFFKDMEELAMKNFEETGEPALSIEQFEEVRKKISTNSEKKNSPIGLFISLGDMGRISLN